MPPAPSAPSPATAVVGRELPAEEWDRLAALPIMAPEGTQPQPDGSAVAVVEIDGQIVATWAALSVIHLEGCWIAPEQRRHPAVVKALVTTMYQMLRERGIPQVVTITQTPEVGALAAKLGGAKIPGDLWILTVGGA